MKKVISSIFSIVNFEFTRNRRSLSANKLSYYQLLIVLGVLPIISPAFAQTTPPANISLPSPAGTAITTSAGLPSQIVTVFLPAVITILGFLTVFYIVFTGIRFIISRGDPERVADAKSRLTYAIVGFIVLILAFAATQLIDRLFLNSGAI